MTTYPPAPLKLQNAEALDYTHSQVAYVGYEGTIFYLSGPFTPILGAQTGVALDTIAHIDADFKHLDNKGAREDGTTWYDSLYDPGELDMVIELGGVDAPSTRKIIADWLGAWSPKRQGKFCWFSPERGEWWCNVRQGKAIPDQFKHDFYQSRMAIFTWTARNDSAFWQSVDSVCNYTNGSAVITEPFGVTGTGLDSNWSQADTGAGYVYVPVANQAGWYDAGSSVTETAICQFVGEGAVSGSNNQFVSVTLDQDMPAPSGGAEAYIDVWGRLDTAGLYGVRGRFGYDTVSLDVLSDGVLSNLFTGTPLTAPVAGDVLTLQCGVTEPQQNTQEALYTSANRIDNQYQLYQNGNPLYVKAASGGGGFFAQLAALIENFFGSLFGFLDTSNTISVGPDYRGWGFGMEAGGTGTGQVIPPDISEWTAGSDTGFIKLTNIGDQPGWPRYLCYGPGTFLIGDGQANPDGTSNSMVSFGPLLAGQVALITTLPRLQSVIDVTPPSSSDAQSAYWQTLSTGSQGLLTRIINFVTNNNVPPLLQQVESWFGVTPPQGPLYSLLSGRFTKALDPMSQQNGPSVSHIACQIQGGNNDSKVIAAVTPQRIWPE